MPNAHTPGPWFYDFAGNTAAVIVDSEGDHVIDLVATSNTTAQSALADNARLIAAAPEMLRALRIGLYHTMAAANRARGIANWNERNGMQGIAAEYLKSAEESDDAAEAIRAVINRATGA